ncbi:hypothetical protein CUB95_02260 [Prevotella intermedia]|nr:hypothetical protein CUB95_02260 [Prevotella intermedia]
MQMTPFPAHYQLVYTNFDFSSFSRISCTVKATVLRCKTAAFATPKRSYHFLRELSLQKQNTFCICLKQEKGYPLSPLNFY